jgi:hypothetical protein
MAPTAPDILEILGPRDPPGDAHAWIRHAVEGLTSYFEELLPLAVQVILHPGSGHESRDETGHAAIADRILQEFALRIRSLQKRGALTDVPHPMVARLLIGIAHDWALHSAVLAHRPPGGRPPLAAFVDVVWRGIAPVKEDVKRARARSAERRKP